MSQSLYSKIETIFKANYLNDSQFLSNEEIAFEIYGKMPRKALSGVVLSISQQMGKVRDNLESEGYLMIANVEVEKRKIRGRKLARPEDADFITNEIQRRVKRRNGTAMPLKTAIKNIGNSGLPMPAQKYLTSGK